MKRYQRFFRIQIALLLAAILFSGSVFVLDSGKTAETLSRYGSSGSEVRRIQTVLQQKGYYSGTIDGIYGSQTVEAVKKFQSSNGLDADGICGTKTLSALGISGSSTALRRGDSGSTVSQVQKKLSSLGYYTGSIDGVYGSQTEAAVRRYQAAKGLTVDGICGVRTMSALGLSSTTSSSQAVSATSGNVYLLARIISAEARGEPYRGQVAVGAVVMNRVKSSKFPNTLSGVIYQKGAFTALTDGQFNQPISDSAYQAAREALSGADPTGGCLYYYNPATATSSWIFSLPVKMTIGKHRFSMGK